MPISIKGVASNLGAHDVMTSAAALERAIFDLSFEQVEADALGLSLENAR